MMIFTLIKTIFAQYVPKDVKVVHLSAPTLLNAILVNMATSYLEITVVMRLVNFHATNVNLESHQSVHLVMPGINLTPITTHVK